LGKGAALEDIPPPLAGEIAQPGQTVKGRPPQKRRCVAPLTAHSRLYEKAGGDGGYIPPEP